MEVSIQSITPEEELADELIKSERVFLNENIGIEGIKDLKKILTTIGIDNLENEKNYFNSTLKNIQYIVDVKKEREQDNIIIDSEYKYYINAGLSKMDKFHGRFMASQNIKMDTLIEQNEKIIGLLEEIAKKL